MTGTPGPTPTESLAPTATPPFTDDHGNSASFATTIDSKETTIVVQGEFDTLDDIDYFKFTDIVPGQTWVFTPEYIPPLTESGKYPTLSVDGSGLTPDPFTGLITYLSGGTTIYLSATPELPQKLGDYRVVIDRFTN